MARKKPPYLPIILIITILIIGFGLFGFSVIPKSTPITINEIRNSTGEITLALTPATINTTLNADSSLSLTVNTNSVKLMVLAVELTYDPTVISTPTIIQGSFLGNILSSPKVENGKITFTYAATPDSGGATGTGEVAIIKFKPIATGVSTITFTPNSIATAVKDGERLPNNSLRSAQDATITVGDEPITTATNTTMPSTPNIFQKIFLGWEIIFQSIFKIFSN